MLDAGGTGYNQAPTVVIDAPPAGGTTSVSVCIYF